MKKPRYTYREFINQPGFHSSAFIYAELGGGEWGTTATLTFADCDRRVNIALGLDGEEIDNSLHKLDTMIEGLKGLRRAVAAEKRRRR